jgi:hypothetical protein
MSYARVKGRTVEPGRVVVRINGIEVDLPVSYADARQLPIVNRKQRRASAAARRRTASERKVSER